MHLERASSDSASGSDRDALVARGVRALGGAGFRALMASDHAAAANLLGRAASLLPEEDPARMELECSLARRFAAWASPTSGPPSSKASSSEPSTQASVGSSCARKVELVHSETGGRYRLAGGTRSSCWKTRSPSSARRGTRLGFARAEHAYASVVGDWQGRADVGLVHVRRMGEAYARLGFPASGRIARGHLRAWPAGPTSSDVAPTLRRRTRTAGGLAADTGVPADAARAPSRRSPGRSRRPARTPTRASAELEALGEEVGRGVAVGSQAAAIEALAGDWAAGGADCSGSPSRRCVSTRRSECGRPTSWRGWARRRSDEATSPAAAAARRRGARRRRRRRRDRDLVETRRGARATRSTGGSGRRCVSAARRCGWPTERTTCSRRPARVSTSPRRSSTPVARPRRPSLVEEALARLDRKGATLPASNARARFADLLAERIEPAAAPRGG